ARPRSMHLTPSSYSRHNIPQLETTLNIPCPTAHPKRQARLVPGHNRLPYNRFCLFGTGTSQIHLISPRDLAPAGDLFTSDVGEVWFDGCRTVVRCSTRRRRSLADAVRTLFAIRLASGAHTTG